MQPCADKNMVSSVKKGTQLMKQIVILKELVLRTVLIRAGKPFCQEAMHVQLHPDFGLGREVRNANMFMKLTKFRQFSIKATEPAKS